MTTFIRDPQFIITKRFDFSASHQLRQLPPEHPCARVHGHNYQVEIELFAYELDPATGFVIDYRELDVFKRWIDETLDHRHLNDVVETPTAEVLAEVMWTKASQLFASGRVYVSAARVKETEKTCAEFRAIGPVQLVKMAIARNDLRIPQ